MIKTSNQSSRGINILKKILKSIGIFLALVIVYLLCVLLLPYISVNTEEKKGNNAVEMYILTNGVHTDLVVPIRSPYQDWSSFLPIKDVKNPNKNYQYLSVGWGDKGFYLNTPEWSDLKFSTAFKAAFWLSDSAMHCTYYEQMKEGKDCIKIQLSQEEYADLTKFIQDKFDLQNGKPIMIPTNAVYSDNDAFYEAKGRYSIFNTCNTWSNDGLKAADQKAALWTATDLGIFQQYEDVGLGDLFHLAD